jgi:hypothetical protein
VVWAWSKNSPYQHLVLAGSTAKGTKGGTIRQPLRHRSLGACFSAVLARRYVGLQYREAISPTLSSFPLALLVSTQCTSDE